jgi:hypothetical protein
MSFAPLFSALPDAQRAIWPELKEISSQFVLYGGTGLALRFGHRQSIDFDFFGNAPIEPAELLERLDLLKGGIVRQKGLNTLKVTVHRAGPVQISFFGVSLGRVREPDWTSDGVTRVASPLDIAACKVAVIQERAEAKDYEDIYALLGHDISLAEALGAAQAIYGEQFSPMIALKALTYFKDGNLESLPEKMKEALRTAAAGVEVIPHFERLGGVVPA